MEWSSDGYVLAVGWEYGWAIFSIGGRCLACGFGIDDVVDNEKFQDAFMHGIKDLVSHRRFQGSLLFGAEEDGGSSGHLAISSWWCLLSQVQTVSLYPLRVVILNTDFTERDGQIFILPFAKSATTCQHSPVRDSLCHRVGH